MIIEFKPKSKTNIKFNENNILEIKASKELISDFKKKLALKLKIKLL